MRTAQQTRCVPRFWLSFALTASANNTRTHVSGETPVLTFAKSLLTLMTVSHGLASAAKYLSTDPAISPLAGFNFLLITSRVLGHSALLPFGGRITNVGKVRLLPRRMRFGATRTEARFARRNDRSAGRSVHLCGTFYGQSRGTDPKLSPDLIAQSLCSIQRRGRLVGESLPPCFLQDLAEEQMLLAHVFGLRPLAHSFIHGDIRRFGCPP